MGSLQDELAKKLGGVPPEAVSGEEALKSLVNQFETSGSKRSAALGMSGVMHQDVRIGDVCLMRFDEYDKEHGSASTSRPAIIWGIYRNGDKVVAVDILLPSSKYISQETVDKKRYTSELYIQTPDELKAAGSRNREIINMQNMWTVPWTSVGQKGFFLDHAGVIGRIKPDIFPHMIVRRHTALMHSPAIDQTRRAHISPNWTYEGLSFSNLGRAGSRLAPEIDCQCRKANVPFNGLDQAMVDRLTRWSEAYYQRHKTKGFVEYPGVAQPLEQWLGWPAWGGPAPAQGAPSSEPAVI
jgi:hypothetical protein